MAISNVPTEPGVFSQFQPTRIFPVLPGGIRVAALVGKGRETNLVNGEVVTKGVLNASDSLANTATVLGATIVDEDQNTYDLDIDYQLTTGAVDWSLTVPATLTGTEIATFDLSGNDKIIKITIADANGGLEQSHTFVDAEFSVPAAATADEVKDVITAQFAGLAATNVGDAIVLTTDNGDNTSLLIGDGDANAILGFTDGSLVETPREPAPAKTYQINYEYAKASGDYVPRFFFNMNDVIAEHGDVSTSNTLSLGAEIVIQQGASVVALVQCDPADGAESNQFRSAIDKLAPVTGINIVVPLTSDTTLFAYVKNHVDTASSITERKERTAIVGMSGSLTVSTLTAQAQALADKRMVLVSPGEATRFVGSGTEVSTLNGSFVAAAIAGIRTSRAFDVADPLTRKEVVGFETIADDFLRAEKVTMLSKGVMVIENVAGIFRVMQQVTTDPSVAENKEYSVVEIIDFVGSNMREVLETIYIGQKILAGTPSQVKTTVQTLLNDQISKEIIVASQNVQAAIDGSDPTQINVSFEISPVFPLNFILITFSLSPNI